jgi:GTPase involved in cell partitioning and DNA repair
MRAGASATSSWATWSAARSSSTSSMAPPRTWCRDWQTIDRELDLYGGDLADKPRITAMNKIDALDADERAERRAALEAAAGPVMLVSGVSREG